MNKIVKLLVSSMLFIWILLASTSTNAFAQSGFPIWCRSPLNLRYELSGTYIDFTPNPVAAGETGASLRPGTCAWVDRPLRTAEPTSILAIQRVDIAPINAGYINDLVQYNLVITSTITPNNRIQFNVRNAGSYLRLNFLNIRILPIITP